MSERNTVIRSLHDVGLAAWFGGSLAGAVGINGAAADVPDRNQRLRVANAGWGRWSPVNLAAIGAHLVGGAGILYANKGRVAGQKGVAASTVAKLVLTGAALGATAWSGALGKKLAHYDGASVEGGTEPAPDTPAEVAKAQQQLKVLQWLIPGPDRRHHRPHLGARRAAAARPAAARHPAKARPAGRGHLLSTPGEHPWTSALV